MADFATAVNQGYADRWSELAKVYRKDPAASSKVALGAALTQDVTKDHDLGRRLADRDFAALLKDLGQTFPGPIQQPA
jgi:hypothetical protein